MTDRFTTGRWAQHSLARRQLLSGALVLGSVGALTACGSQTAFEVDTSAPPSSGGVLRVGLTGGSTADTLDAHIPVNSGDSARVINLYEPLVERDDDYEIAYRLAESLEPDADGSVWTLRLRENLLFSDGSDLTADDVVFTFERVTDPEDPKTNAANLAMFERAVAVDDRTVEIHLSAPNAVLDDALAQYSMGIVPRDYDPAVPVGAGPFRLKSFSAGMSTVLERNPHYWDQAPHLDEVELLNFNDTDALINALLSSQVDCVGQIPLALVEVIESDERMAVLNSATGMWLPFTMRVDVEPFDDVRVRQAFRLAVDRQQMIEQVLSGYGDLGNDMFSPYDSSYPSDFPQREQDVAEARRLLDEAGYPDGITVELVTAPIQSGVVEAAQVFAQQAADAGITVEIRRVDTTTFFGEQYLQWDFAQSFWYTRNFLPQARNCATADSPFNETGWVNEDFTALLDEAQAELDETRRNELVRQAQQQLFDEGGYIIWGFANQVDAYQRYVLGLQENATGLPLSGYTFRRVWLGEVS
ncbi:ABC transporter substrate-binding protein [Kocuria coralli]|uniref:ABC transporter substrate-binding protein n=1 Tax=Kocuria coralli TaxID=1461025 RepID=A0A5J5KYU2_9MICC|nr:ABC transporter substrate-binding protein [Kocuria coralli]KAA9394702.1 ABC transporter substrate-binding protein [Kocuria coralli]